MLNSMPHRCRRTTKNNIQMKVIKKKKVAVWIYLLTGKSPTSLRYFFFFLLFSFENIIFQYTFPEKNFRKFHTFPKISFFKFNLVTTILLVANTKFPNNHSVMFVFWLTCFFKGRWRSGIVSVLLCLRSQVRPPLLS